MSVEELKEKLLDDGYENVMIIESETDKYTGTVHDYEVNYNINYGRRGRHINKNKQWLN